MDYGQLIAEVTDRCGESVAPNARLYVTLAEIDINKALTVSENERIRTVTTDASGYVDLPTGFQKMRLVVVNGQTIPARHLEDIIAGVPGYAVRAGKLLSAYTSTAHSLYYYTSIDPLNDFGTNWVLETWPNVYIEALLVQVYRAKGDEKEAAAQIRLNRAIKDILDADATTRFLATPYRIEGPTP